MAFDIADPYDLPCELFGAFRREQRREQDKYLNEVSNPVSQLVRKVDKLCDRNSSFHASSTRTHLTVCMYVRYACVYCDRLICDLSVRVGIRLEALF